MSKELLNDIIHDFDPAKFTDFFREKNHNFERKTKRLSEYDTERFSACTKIGEIKFETDNLIVVHAKSDSDLTERTGKKLQYEIAKKILKTEMYDAGIFIFYDSNGSFRFSLVFASYTGKREWSTFKRFTYFVKDGLTNKTFLQRIGLLNFESLKSIKEAFSVDKVTKEFYKDIANWYFWTVDNCKFPDSAEGIDNGRNIAVIRLITRIIFIWFMKELNLVPANLFNKKYIASILLGNTKDESSYYKAILQNLFFATLSTPKEQRKFTDETRHNKGHNDDFGNQSVFRFHEFYKNPEHIKSYFEDIPFLNGGLFECLDSSKENIYLDGFTRRKQYQPHVPDFLFFSGEREANLNPWYDTKNKKYVVKGLFEILSAYNFTVDENTADDADIALDPELLGKVFENLLASFNPETSTTARKATGSFYTPREIVDYMVTESLKEYFKTHLEDTEDFENKIESLFNPALDTNPFIDGSRDTKNLVNLIENVRIVDPAVGSGAFPMGILNKLVFILNKVDKGNKLWKDAQLKSVDCIQDSRLREETRGHIENYFKNKNPDYGRKLYLIQRCIYGVDIQQIAVEISKLRFFISLLVDEKIDKYKENWGIEPLPNLDFKIMQGNSLLEEYEGIKLFDESLFKNIDDNKENQLKILKRKQKELEKEALKLNSENKYNHKAKKEYAKKFEVVSKKIESLLYGKKTADNIFDIFDEQFETNRKRDTLNKLHKDFFDASKKEQKDKIKNEIEKLEWELIESTLISQGKKSKLDELNKIRKSNSRPFFLWKLHFADVFEKGGFDIVIGNPPYIQLQKDNGKLANLYKDCDFQTFERTGDIYSLFYEKGINLLKQKGHLCYITSNKWMRAGYGESLREFFVNYNPILIIDLGPGIFENATVDVNILLLNKNTYLSNTRGVVINSLERERYFDLFVKSNLIDLPFLNSNSWYIDTKIIQKLKEKIAIGGKPLKEWNVKIYRGILTGFNNAFFVNNDTKNILCKEDSNNHNLLKPIIRGRDIKKYYYDWAGIWVLFIPWHFPLNNDKSIQGASLKAEQEFKKRYPVAYNHLLQYKSALEDRNKEETGIRYEWYALQRCANTYYEEFEKEKIVFKAVGRNLTFSLLEKGKLVTAPASFMTSEYNKYILGVLCSNFAKYYIYEHSDKTGAGDIMLNVQSFEKIPIPPISNKNLKFIKEIEFKVNLVINNLAINKSIVELEGDINSLVYKLFDFSKDEIKIIEQNR